MTSHYQFFATAPKFTEDLLLDELRGLGAEQLKQTVGGVSFSGDLTVGYSACLWSRIANHVLLNLKTAKVSNDTELYHAISDIDWSRHFDTSDTFAIDFFASHSNITHAQYGAQKCKDAIVDQFRHHTGSRPNVDKTDAAIRLNVHLKNNIATISLDLSGHSLHQRGYRLRNVSAPLKENLAAAFLLRAGWSAQNPPQFTLIDPMCGSGTLLIEAAWIAANIAPGLLREDFGFIAWKQHDASRWQQLRHEAHTAARINSPDLPKFLGFDEDDHALQAARFNAEQAGLANLIKLSHQEISNFENLDYGDTGLVICNPPYGERLSDNERLLPVYETLGKQLKQHFAGWKASIITNDESLAKRTGLHARRINKLYNGKLLCKLYHFDIHKQHIVHDHYTRTENDKVDLDLNLDLRNRLYKNLKHLKKWADKQNICCYRLYEADIPEYNFALDLYHSDQLYVVMQEYAAPTKIDPAKAQKRFNIAKQTVLRTLDISPQQLFVKQRKRQSGSSQYQKLSSTQHLHIVEEGPCRFYVNFQDYLDTGLFLDHRITRELIREMAAGKRFLNLFCYTGTASVHAAMGNASSTTSVDMSTAYLAWCQENFKLNKIPMKQHQFIKADCLEWIKQQKDKYDFIFVDPPTFSNSKKMQGIFDVQQHYVDLLLECIRLLNQKGQLLFSTNHRKFQFDDTLFPGMNIEDISRRTLPEDFIRNARIHRCWLISHNVQR